MDSDTAPHDDPALPSDTESAPHVEPGAIMDFEPAINDNHGTNLDSSATRTSSENEEAMRCVNCGCSIRRTRSHILNTNSERETHIRILLQLPCRPKNGGLLRSRYDNYLVFKLG